LSKHLTASQLIEWEAYDTLEPIGEWRADYRISFLASLLTNLVIQTMGKKGAKLTKIEDFLFDWDGSVADSKKQTPKQMKDILMAIVNKNKKK